MQCNFSLRCTVVLFLPKGKKRASLAGMEKKGLCMPCPIVVLTSPSSRVDCCSDEIKAAALPRAVHLH